MGKKGLHRPILMHKSVLMYKAVLVYKAVGVVQNFHLEGLRFKPLAGHIFISKNFHCLFFQWESCQCLAVYGLALAFTPWNIG